MNLAPGEWYRDLESGQEFQLLAVQDETVEIVDRDGCRRTTNRMLWENTMAPRRVKRCDTEARARQYARSFDKARAHNGLPPLTVEQDTDGWWVVNPDTDAPVHVPRTPLLPRNSQGRREP